MAAGSSIGDLFRLTTFGESHGKGIGGIIDGCPPNLDIDTDFINQQLARRRPGQSKIVTQRKEPDEIELLSGVFEGKSTGTPIAFMIWNQDQRSKDYSHIQDKYRPSHADYTYDAKYGHRDYRGGGRSSARETAARVAAGAIAQIALRKYGISVSAYVSQVGHLKMNALPTLQQLSSIESTPVRCPDADLAEEMITLISDIKKQGDTIGGVVSGLISGVPPGLGDPVFHKLHADLAKAMMSINAAKGFDYGAGFDSVTMRGSEHNDPFTVNADGKVASTSNFSGGIQGGISNGMPIYFRIAFKPVATIIPEQESIDKHGNSVKVTGKGRHDPCVVPRAVPIVEAMSSLVILDHLLKYKAYTS